MTCKTTCYRITGLVSGDDGIYTNECGIWFHPDRTEVPAGALLDELNDSGAGARTRTLCPCCHLASEEICYAVKNDLGVVIEQVRTVLSREFSSVYMVASSEYVTQVIDVDDDASTIFTNGDPFDPGLVVAPNTIEIMDCCDI